MHGWNFKAIEGAIGQEGANKQHGEIQRVRHIAEISGESAKNASSNRAENNACRENLCRHSQVDQGPLGGSAHPVSAR